MVVNGIDTCDISIVVQGAIDMTCTDKCLNLLRKSFPGAEIILSTWGNSVLAGLNYDIVVINKDPGDLRYRHFVDNTNRQIVSTKNGLMQCTKKYSLKIRTDCMVYSPKLLSYWNEYPKRTSEYKWFSHKIILPTLYCKRYLDQYSLIPTPFHYSDWLQFGLTKDVSKIWDIELISDKMYLQYFSQKNYRGVKMQRRWFDSRFTAENYIFSSAIKREFPKIEYNSLEEYSSYTMKISEQVLINNFILKEPKSLDINICKVPYTEQIENIDKFRRSQPDCLYTEQQYKQMYEGITL